MICNQCGKEFDVLYPDLWRYKKGILWFCSWHCLRADELKRKEEYSMAGKLTEEQKKKAINIALTDSNPMAPTNYLKELGLANPYAAWSYIKQKLKKNDPETLRKIEENNGTAAIKEMLASANGMAKVEKVETVPPVDLSLQGGVNYQLKVQEDRKKDIAWTIPAIRHCVFGEWYYDQEHNRIDWRTPEGDEISFSPDGWKQLINDVLPEAMKRLGV